MSGFPLPPRGLPGGGGGGGGFPAPPAGMSSSVLDRVRLFLPRMEQVGSVVLYK